MRESIDFDLEQKTFYVSANEFKEKIENFQNRFHIMERANKVSIIRWLLLLLLVLAVAGLLGYIWFILNMKIENLGIHVEDINNMLEQEKDKREEVEAALKKEESHGQLLKKIIDSMKYYSLRSNVEPFSPNEGNIYVKGRPVCDDSWDIKDAIVACKSLGFKTAVNHTKKSVFGKVPDNFIMDEVICDGTESSLLDCEHSETHDCSENEGAGVICS